jgi:hypothetical protein
LTVSRSTKAQDVQSRAPVTTPMLGGVRGLSALLNELGGVTQIVGIRAMPPSWLCPVHVAPVAIA